MAFEYYYDCNGLKSSYDPDYYKLVPCSNGKGYYPVLKGFDVSNTSNHDRYHGNINSIFYAIKSLSSDYSYYIGSFVSKGNFDGYEWGYYPIVVTLPGFEVKFIVYQDYQNGNNPVLCGHQLYEEFYFNVVKSAPFYNQIGAFSGKDSRELIDYIYSLVQTYESYKNLCCLLKC